MGAMENPATGARPGTINYKLWLQVALGLLVTGLALYLALRQVDLRQVGLVLRQASPFYVVLALLSVVANTLLKALRWKVLLGQAGAGVSLGRILAVILAGQTINAFVPVRLGDLGRAVVVGGMGAGKAYALGTVLLEKALDLAWYGLLIAGLLIWMPLPAWINQSALALAGIALLGLAGAFILAYQARRAIALSERLAVRLPGALSDWLMPRLRAALGGLAVLRRRSDLLWLAFLTTLVWVTAVLNNWLTLRAIGLGDLPLTAAWLLAVALQAGVALPSVAGRLGIFEYICMLSLSIFGVSASPALAYGLLLHAIVAGPATLAGAACIGWLGMRFKDWWQIEH